MGLMNRYIVGPGSLFSWALSAPRGTGYLVNRDRPNRVFSRGRTAELLGSIAMDQAFKTTERHGRLCRTPMKVPVADSPTS